MEAELVPGGAFCGSSSLKPIIYHPCETPVGRVQAGAWGFLTQNQKVWFTFIFQGNDSGLSILGRVMEGAWVGGDLFLRILTLGAYHLGSD